MKEEQFKDLQEASILQPLASKYGTGSIVLETNSQGFVTGLTLQRLDLESVPEGIWQLSHLQKLDLRCNQITMLSPNIALLENLQILELDFNQLTSLPPEIAQLTNLQRLTLQSNQLKAFPIEITALKELHHLGIGNKKALPKNAFKKSDREKYLQKEQKNQLDYLPAAIANLTNLQRLDISDLQLKHLPNEIGALKSLRTLYVGGNQLDPLPVE